MPVTGWLRGTVKAVPSGDTVLIVANAGPTVRRCFFIYARSSCLFFASSRDHLRGRQDRSFLSLFAFFFFFVVRLMFIQRETRKSADTKQNLYL